MEILVGHWDGYTIHTNNFRLYHEPTADKFVFITHGLDWAFRRPNLSIQPPLKSLVGRAVFGTDEGRRLFRERLGILYTNVFRVPVVTNRMEQELMKVRHAHKGAEEGLLSMAELLQRLAPYFEPESGGHMIDQAWQPRLVDGMVRAYLVEDRVAGFGHQAINALHPAKDGEPPPATSPRLYHPADLPQFQTLRHHLEAGWIALLRERVGLGREQLPMLWDCDFMFGDQPGNYVLCEINVSSLIPMPEEAPAALAAVLRDRLLRRRSENLRAPEA